MRTGPSLTDLNNRMILWEYEQAYSRGRYGLAKKIYKANPQIEEWQWLCITLPYDLMYYCRMI